MRSPCAPDIVERDLASSRACPRRAARRERYDSLLAQRLRQALPRVVELRLYRSERAVENLRRLVLAKARVKPEDRHRAHAGRELVERRLQRFEPRLDRCARPLGQLVRRPEPRQEPLAPRDLQRPRGGDAQRPAADAARGTEPAEPADDIEQRLLRRVFRCRRPGTDDEASGADDVRTKLGE